MGKTGVTTPLENFINISSDLGEGSEFQRTITRALTTNIEGP